VSEQVTIVKAEEDEFDGFTKLLLLRQLASFEQMVSRDADAITTCTDLLRASQVRGAKRAFVFTDGLGTSGLPMILALKAADEQGVDVRGEDRRRVPRHGCLPTAHATGRARVQAWVWDTTASSWRTSTATG
jgi:hypothetical protein